MNDKSTQDTRSVITPTIAIRSLVHAGHEKFARTFPGKQQSFDAMIWNVGELNDRPTTQQRTHLGIDPILGGLKRGN
jgi:hypothetical protein